MSDFKPTEEQNAITEAGKTTTSNLCVVARAGAAKTSTLILLAEALPAVDILCLAFNKAIALEMSERLPSNCEAKTLHALGYKAWQSFIGRRCKINTRKSYFILKDFLENPAVSQTERDEIYDELSETLDMISKAKQAGWLPENHGTPARPLVDDFQFWETLPFEPTDFQRELVEAVVIKSYQAAQTGDIDFDDMIWCPAISAVSWPTPSLTLVDEAQDLSNINHHMLKKIVKNRRLIAVGDPYQAIYGFRGANVDSMNRLKEQFSMEEYRLTISFRCGKAITENARWRAEDMRSPDWAGEGKVDILSVWDEGILSDGDAIICRNNAPLFSLAIKLIKVGRLPEIAGRDMAAPLMKIMEKLGKKTLPRDGAIHALEKWRSKQLEKAREGARSGVHDKAECIKIMLNQTDTLGDAQAYLKHLLDRPGRIKLMTGHKSKGLEFDNVFFLDQHLCDIERGQDANIKYVIETRAKKYLAYVYSDGFMED